MILLALCAIAIVTTVLELGPPAGASARDRIVTAQRGVVQSTVSGSGTLQPTTTTNVNFRTSGQLSHVYVSQGQSVASGQVLADLDAASARAAVDEAQANLVSANAKLGEAQSETVSETTSTTSAPATTATATAARTPPSSGTKSGSQQQQQSQQQTGASRQTTNAAATQSSGGQSSSGQSAAAGVSAAQAAADVASAQAGVESAQVSLDAARRTLTQTKLVAPASGVVTAVNGQVGDTVGTGGGSSAGGAGGAGASSSSSSSSTTGGGGSSAAGSGGAGGGTRAGSSTGSDTSSSAAGSSGSSAFVVISNIRHLQLQVPLSESDIHRVQVNQSASVTVNALPGEKLAAHVTAIDDMPTTNNGVVSYTVTLALDQSENGLKPGMTASAQVVVSQIDGVITVPSSAVSRRGVASTVTVVRGGKKSVQPIVTGITGDSTIQIISGLSAGQQVAIAIPTGSSRGAGAGAGGTGGGFRIGGGLGGGGGFGGGGGGFRRAAGPGGAG